MLEAISVLDLSDERGIVCGWMFAELGADVVCVEPPGGSRARTCGPFAEDDRDLERSLFWWSYARGKRSVVLDLDREADRDTVRSLARHVDVLVESRAPGEMARLGLGYDALRADHPGLVYVSVTPFGQDGPKAAWAASDLTVLAAGGPLWLQGDEDRPPVRVSLPQAFHHAAAEGGAAALVALHERNRSGLGQHIDVSAQQAVTLATQSDIVSARVGDPPGIRYAGGGRVGPFVLRIVFPAKDGHVSITFVFGSAIGPATARLMKCVEEDGFCDAELADKDWIGFAELVMSGKEPVETFERAKTVVDAWTGSKTKSELLALAMDRNLLIAPVSTMRDVVDSPQLAARAFFESAERPDGEGSVTQLGPFARFSGVPRRAAQRAPRLGEHTDEVLAELAARSEPERAQVTSISEAPPLAGVKVLDFMWAIAGPMSTRMLADYGATVVRIESPTRPDVCRTVRPFIGGVPDLETAALFHTCNAGKQMITLDLAQEATRDVVHDLVRWADVVCESFRPGMMHKLGFDYESLRAVNPQLIMLSTCLMGQDGPLARYAGYGNLAAALSGFFDLTGWADRDPAGPYGAYTDYIAPKFNAASILTALDHRRRTGEGQYIDLAQAEAATHFLAPALLDVLVNDHMLTRAGNRDDRFAPNGCYPVEGDDAWIAISVEDDAGFEALCEELGAADLGSDARFRSQAERLEATSELDRALAAYTGRRKGPELEAALQARGVAAHCVLDSAACLADAQLEARGHFIALEGEGISTTIEATRSRLSRTPARADETPPTLGRDTQKVLEMLGYDSERITELVIAGVLG